MALAYAKDWAVANKEGAVMESDTFKTTPPDLIVEIAKRFEQYILTGL